MEFKINPEFELANKVEKDFKLSDDQLDSVVNTLSESRNETDVLMEKIEKEHENEDNSNFPLEKGQAQYVGDGVLMPIDEDDELDFEFDDLGQMDESIEKIIEDAFNESIANRVDMTDEEAVRFTQLILKIRAKENVGKIYDQLPESLKKEINKVVDSENIQLKDRKNALEFIARSTVDEIISEAELDSLSIDFEKALKQLIPDTLELYSEFNRDYIENDFLEVADKIREDNPKTADNLLAMRQGYMDAYTYEKMYKVFESSKVQKHVRRCEVVWSRTNSEYLRLAEVCKFKLYPLKDVEIGLIKLGFTEIQAKRIITLFAYTYTHGVEDYKNEEVYNDIYRNAFANYFESNIINLSISNPVALSEFSNHILDNLKALCNHIDTTIEAKEAELSSKKKKK